MPSRQADKACCEGIADNSMDIFADYLIVYAVVWYTCFAYSRYPLGISRKKRCAGIYKMDWGYPGSHASYNLGDCVEAADDDARLPVYGIYQRFQEDWETKGYKDATGFPETSYRENQKRVIVDKLRLAIKEALLRYDDKITEIESHINQAGQNGLVETLEKYRQERMKLVAHRGELDLLDKDAREIGEKTKAILISYDMGFTRGMVSLSNEIVNEIMNR